MNSGSRASAFRHELADMSPQPARQIGRWTLGRRLGKGGQGRVYQATAAEGGEIFALKRLSAKTAKKLGRFEQEIQHHAELSKRRAPNIIPLLEHGIDYRPDGTAEGYLVMPLAVGLKMPSWPV